MQSVLEDLGPQFERATGHQLAISFATGGGTVKRVQDGEAADVVITLQQGIDTLVKAGKAPAGSVAALARAGIFVAVRKGAPKPDVSSPDALKRTLLAARSSPMSIQRAAGRAASISPRCSIAWGSPVR
jgi:molybdate transport system substrate-binding protein